MISPCPWGRRRAGGQTRELLASTSAGIALLFPGVAPHVIPRRLPEARLVVLSERQTPYPLRALPEVQVGDHKTERPSMLRRQRLAVVLVGEEHALGLEVCQREGCGVVAVAAHPHALRLLPP